MRQAAGDDRNKILILGATSAIARALAEDLASGGAAVYLAARDLADAESTARDIAIRHRVPALAGFFDATDLASHEEFLNRAVAELGGLTVAVVAFGNMFDQREAERDVALAERMIAANYTGAVSILTHLANFFEEQKSGTIVGISSVAGDRGRQSNYVYGSTKAAVSAFLQGLRNRLFHHGVAVITVKPGFVDTAMTYGLKLPPIVAPPAKAARDIRRAIDRGGPDVLYTPFFWRWIMLIIKLIPEFVFKRLKT